LSPQKCDVAAVLAALFIAYKLSCTDARLHEPLPSQRCSNHHPFGWRRLRKRRRTSM
jgi:hypothetical protein